MFDTSLSQEGFKSITHKLTSVVATKSLLDFPIWCRVSYKFFCGLYSVTFRSQKVDHVCA